MSGAYDALNTVIPYNDPHYADYRAELKVEPEQVLAIDDKVGFHPSMAPIKDLYDQGKVAVIQGIGYPNPDSLPLPFHGHLAYRGAGQDGHRRLVGPGHRGVGPAEGKCADCGELRTRSAPGPRHAGSLGGVSRQPGDLRRVDWN